MKSPLIMSMFEIRQLLRHQASLRAPENDDAGLLIEAARYIEQNGTMKEELERALREIDQLSNSERTERTEETRMRYGIKTRAEEDAELELQIDKIG